MSRTKVAVLLSGGVDSSVALALLKQQAEKCHYELQAFYLKVWLQDEMIRLGDCPWELDIDYAQRVCKLLEVPFQVISLQQAYWDQVVSYTIREVKKGNTPNPDVFCNSLIKFGAFIDQIDPTYRFIASGHYARIERKQIGVGEEALEEVRLRTSLDKVKDQTYFLAYLKKDQLSKCLFPLGDRLIGKNEVRKLAQEYRLPNWDRKDSQGICFLGKIKFRDFIELHLGVQKGKILHARTKRLLGEHRGYWFYTLGQRQGLGLSDGPWYVVGKEVKENIVYVAPTLLSGKQIHRLKIEGLNWLGEMDVTGLITDEDDKSKINSLSVKLRHGVSRYPCKFHQMDRERNILEITIDSDQLDQGYAPGQFAVFYQEDLCLGSGIIRPWN